MTAALAIVAPMFILMGCGWVAVKIALFPPAAVKGLSNFVFYFATPCLLFRGVAAGGAIGHDEIAVVYAYFAASLLLFFAMMATGRLLFRLTLSEQAVMGFTATFSNTVMLGIPLVYTTFGERGMLPATLITSFHSIILFTLATALVELGGAGTGKGAGLRDLPRTLLGILRNPVLVAIGAGFLFRFGGASLPVMLDRAVALLAEAATPCSLFALGASMTGFRIAGNPRESVVLIIAKMIVHPAAVWLFATKIVPLEPLQVAVATMMAALPSGANAFILAERYGVYLERTATSVLVTTTLSIATAALLVAHYAPLR